MIKVIKFIICTFFLVSATNKAVNAGPYTDTFGKCIVKSTTQIEKDAVKNEGKQAVTDAFALLGKVSMGALMTDQNVQKAMGRYVKFMDLEKLKSLFAE